MTDSEINRRLAEVMLEMLRNNVEADCSNCRHDLTVRAEYTGACDLCADDTSRYLGWEPR